MAGRGTQQGWLGRNIVWIAVLGVLVAVAVGALLVVGLLSEATQSSGYAEGVALAEAHPAVIEALGEPVRARLGVRDLARLHDDEGNTDLEVPIVGSSGEGRLHIVATRRDGGWALERVVVTVGADARRIDVLAGS